MKVERSFYASFSSSLFYFFILYQVTEALGCRQMIFNNELHDKMLKNHVFASVATADDSNCRAQCFMDSRCISYNFYKREDHEKPFTCELSDSDHILHPKDLAERLNVVYNSAENSCNCSMKNMICRFNFADGTHRCECKPGFTGANCEMQWITASKDPICVGTKGNSFGKIIIPYPGNASTFKLVYQSGGVSSMGNSNQGNWGSTYIGSKKIEIIITDSSNMLVAPPSKSTSFNMLFGLMSYSLPGQTNMSPELRFPDLEPPLQVVKDQEFRIWFGQDLTNIREGDNYGTTCAMVYILYVWR